MTLLSDSIRRLPKADLHVHLEGTITPDMARRIAARNGVTLSPQLMDAQGDSFHWVSDGTPQGSLVGFLKAYDEATAVMKTTEDYTDITYDYLRRSAAEGSIYAELFISVDHGHMVGLSYAEMVDAIAKGYDRARAETGIEARLISTCVRHYGPESAIRAAHETRDHIHPLVTGFGMAGDENAFTIADFKPAFEQCGLGRWTAHAGEASGPATVRDAREKLHIRRFGHMVRAIEDEEVMAEQKSINAVPEVCVSSNLSLGVYADYAAHPLRRFFDYGLKVTLGSDDPSFFNTGIGREYQIAHDKFRFNETELLRLTRNAIEEAFTDDACRASLLDRVDGFKAA